MNTMVTLDGENRCCSRARNPIYLSDQSGFTRARKTNWLMLKKKNTRAEFIDLTNQVFGRLIVIERAENNKFGTAMWLCRCRCGQETVVQSSALLANKTPTRSCGCKKRERIVALNKSRPGHNFLAGHGKAQEAECFERF